MSRTGTLPPEALPAGAWRGRMPVRFAHCDPAGIVYFARYFDMMNGVVEDWFAEALGLDYHDIIARRRVGLGYVSARAEFRRPARMGEALTFVLLIERIGRSTAALDLHGYNAGEPALTGHLIMVATSLETHRAIPLPADIRAGLERYRERCRCLS
ncbi:MAG TPA: thioesterase family protein [Dongiaceae bacterium]|nr:thioesterase family protein [Dongiaceae bacterium]